MNEINRASYNGGLAATPAREPVVQSPGQDRRLNLKPLPLLERYAIDAAKNKSSWQIPEYGKKILRGITVVQNALLKANACVIGGIAGGGVGAVGGGVAGVAIGGLGGTTLGSVIGPEGSALGLMVGGSGGGIGGALYGGVKGALYGCHVLMDPIGKNIDPLTDRILEKLE